MTSVEPDWGFCCLAQFLWIRTILYDAVMYIRPAGVVRCPPNNGQIVRHRLQFRSLGDLDALGFLRRRKYLSAGSVGRDQADNDNRACQCPKQSIHGQTSDCCYLPKTIQET